MAKKMDAQAFKEAVKALNGVLKEQGEKPIKHVAVKRADVLDAFVNHVMDFIDNDKVADLPDNVIDFYNEYVAGAEDDDAVEPEEKPAKKTTKKTGKKTTKKSTKKPAEKKEKKPGIVMLAVDAYMNGGCKSAKEIVEKIQDQFPDRNIAKTVSHCYGVLKHIEPNK